ncbi:MAG: S9 family peptidase [Pseudomonadota bacterium]
MTRFLAGVTVFAMVTVGCANADARTRLLAAESILDWAFAADPRWSPDGSVLAYTEVQSLAEDDRYQSRIRLINPGEGARALTATDSNAHSPRWSPDGLQLAFLSNRDGSQQVWAVDFRGGEPRALTAVDGNVVRFEWSPSGGALALVVAAPVESEAAPFITRDLRIRSDGRSGYSNAPIPRLAYLALDPPAELRWLTDGLRINGSPAWSADGASVYVSALPEDDALTVDTDVFRIAVADAATERLTDSPGPDRAFPSPDGRWLVVIGYQRANPSASYQTSEIRLVDLTGENPTALLTEQFDYGVGDGMAGDVNAPVPGGQRIVWTDDSQSLLFTSAIEGRVQIVRADIAAGSVDTLTEIDAGELREFDVAIDGRIAAMFSRHDLPPNLVAFSLDRGSRGAWRQLTRLNAAALAEIDLADYEEWRIPGAGGAQEEGAQPPLQAWLISPPKLDRRRRYPLLLYIHGGPHSMYGSNFFHEFHVLAALGFHVLIVNPRGSTGYGAEFGNSIQYRYPGDDADDLLRALDHVIENVSTIDPARVGVAGGSGGGLLTTWLIGQTDRFVAASAHRSVTNWLSFVGTADLNRYFVEHWFEAPPWGAEDSYLDRSPLRFVEQVTTPVQILHSDRDFRTPLEQSLQYYTALRVLGKPAELVIVRDESHGLSRGGRPSNRLARLAAISRWFRQYLEPEKATR